MERKRDAPVFSTMSVDERGTSNSEETRENGEHEDSVSVTWRLASPAGSLTQTVPFSARGTSQFLERLRMYIRRGTLVTLRRVPVKAPLSLTLDTTEGEEVPQEAVVRRREPSSCPGPGVLEEPRRTRFPGAAPFEGDDFFYRGLTLRRTFAGCDWPTGP